VYRSPKRWCVVARKAAEAVQKNVADAVIGTLGLNGERMSKVDTAWLRMDSSSNLMMIVGVWVTKPGLPLADLKQRVEDRLLKYPRFKQRVVEDAAGASWVEDAEFDIDRHVVTETLAKKPRGREQEALQERLAALTHGAAGSQPAALAVPFGRELQRRFCL